MRVLARKEYGSRECPSCACEIPQNVNKCPICGYLFPVATPRQKRMRLWGALLMLGLIAFLYLLRYL